MLVLGRLDFGVCAAVDAELLVRQDVFLLGQALVHLYSLGPEIHVSGEYAGAWVTGPQEGRVGVAFAFHVVLSMQPMPLHCT